MLKGDVPAFPRPPCTVRRLSLRGAKPYLSLSSQNITTDSLTQKNGFVNMNRSVDGDFPVGTGDAEFAAGPLPFLRRRFCMAPCRGRRLCRPDISGWHRRCLFCSDTATVPSATHFFCLARKSGQKEALDTDRIVPQATEGARRRTLRPAHETLSTKLHYSAACVETTLPSRIAATQEAGKTPCRGNGRPSAYAPVVQNRNRPSIPEMRRNGIIAVCPQVRVVHSSEP